MTTLRNDFMRLHLSNSVAHPQLRAYGFDWPPPECIYLDALGGTIREARDGDDENYVMVRTNYSQLPDDVANHPHIARGAEYRYLRELPEASSR